MYELEDRNNSCAGVSALIISLIYLEQRKKMYYFGNYEFVLGLFEIIDYASHLLNYVLSNNTENSVLYISVYHAYQKIEKNIMHRKK